MARPVHMEKFLLDCLKGEARAARNRGESVNTCRAYAYEQARGIKRVFGSLDYAAQADIALSDLASDTIVRVISKTHREGRDIEFVPSQPPIA